MESQPPPISYDRTALLREVRKLQSLANSCQSAEDSFICIVNLENLQNRHLLLIFQIVDNSVTQIRPLAFPRCKAVQKEILREGRLDKCCAFRGRVNHLDELS
jgi:hypothetical protein